MPALGLVAARRAANNAGIEVNPERFMTDPDLPQAMQLVLDQMQEQQAARNAAQAAAYVAMARHLAVRGHAELAVLARELETLSQAQADEDWQALLQGLAGGLRLLRVPG
jgi:cobalamin biosynthesis Mg chelatase CobN